MFARVGAGGQQRVVKVYHQACIIERALQSANVDMAKFLLLSRGL